MALIERMCDREPQRISISNTIRKLYSIQFQAGLSKEEIHIDRGWTNEFLAKLLKIFDDTKLIKTSFMIFDPN